MTEEARPIYKLLRVKQVTEMTGLPQASIYALMARDEFPRQVPISINRVGWVDTEVQAWVCARVDAAAKQTHNPRGCRPTKPASDNARPARTPRRINSRADGRRSARN